MTVASHMCVYHIDLIVLTMSLPLPACPTMEIKEITLEESKAIIQWKISGSVSHVIVRSCDVDDTESCVNTTLNDPTTTNTATVDIPVGASQYSFDFYLYEADDLVKSYVGSDGASKSRSSKLSARMFASTQWLEHLSNIVITDSCQFYL